MKSIIEKMIKRESFFSYDLKTGGQIIGYVHLVAFIFNILRLFYVLYEWGLSIWIEATISGIFWLHNRHHLFIEMNSENILIKCDFIFVNIVVLLAVTIGWLYGIHKVSDFLTDFHQIFPQWLVRVDQAE